MKQYRFVVFVLLAIMLLVTACGGQTPTAVTTEAPTAPPVSAPATLLPTTAPAESPTVLKIADTATFTTWDPIKSFSTEASYMPNMYEQLLRINPAGSAEKFTPLLAERWESSDDGLTWTFFLRKGVTFHDGETMNAAAVKQSIEAAADHGGASFIWYPLGGITTPDDYTVVFTLTYAAPLDLIASSLYDAWIISPKALDAAAADPNYFENGIEAGTGPYMLDSYTPDQELVLKKYDNYWGGWKDNNFDVVDVQIVPESTTQLQLLQGGEVDLASRIIADNLNQFENDPNFTIYKENTLDNYLGFFNTMRPPLDDPAVRQALSYAIPYQDILKVMLMGSQAYGPVPQGVWPWSDQVTQYNYDLEKAKQLLADAGYPGGGFSLRLTYASENSSEATFAPLIKDSFAQVGVDVTIEPILWNQQWEQAKSDPASAQDIFLLLYWPTYSDAGSDNLWSMFYGYPDPPHLNVTAFNLSYWYDQDYNDMLDKAIGETVTDPAASQQDYIEAMNYLVDQAPAVFLFDTQTPYVIPSHIEGFQYNLNYPFTPYFYYQLTLAQ